MNRSAKGFRVAAGLLVLLNLAAFCLPVTGRTQENYAALKWSQLDYIKNMFGGNRPYGGTEAGITSTQIIWILCFMALPLLLSVVAGIWGIVGNYRQKASSILTFVILFLYAGLYVSVGLLWPAASKGQMYVRETACVMHLVFSGCGAAAALAALISTPKKVTAQKGSIPQVKELKQEQVEAKYNIILENARKEPANKEYVPGNPRGVLVGLAGIYAGAEIPLAGGDWITLGRQTNNHLVFEGQAKVSRSHCKIRWDGSRKKYILCDYSTRGTYVNGSEECLPQNLELDIPPGTVIAIGDDTNTFRLE